MVVLYGIAVVAGALALVGWVIWDTLAEAPGSSGQGPTVRFGMRGRRAVTAVLGFGLGGISASFAGWNQALALGAAVAGAVLLAMSAHVLADDHA